MLAPCECRTIEQSLRIVSFRNFEAIVEVQGDCVIIGSEADTIAIEGDTLTEIIKWWQCKQRVRKG
jgi:sulfur carrier protein ThiS